ncbi:endonuclease VII domain-containing protein [Streptomyces sp. NPDC058398]|uniref:endonuclease VII domain-containing protein n=1 Tax=Streptomyces sp. NPDC058398 TaxID=3346479 RepID=UPI003660712A
MPNQKAPKRLDSRPCVICMTPFEPYRDSQIACSRSCREKAARQGLTNPKATERNLICRSCGEPFRAVWSGLGTQPRCAACTARIATESQGRKNAARRVEVNPSRRQVNLRDLLKKLYGLTLDEYAAMLARQDGRCAICGSPPDPDGVKAASRLHVDHDHATGAVRELLCNRCNMGVGYFRDDPDLLRAAAEYIERHRSGA